MTTKTKKIKKAKKAKKKVVPKHKFMPKDMNPRWLKRFSGPWDEVHAELLKSMTETSDHAMAYKRDLFAHLNAARYTAINECIRLVMKKTNSKLDAVNDMQALLQDMRMQSCIANS